MGKNLSRIDQAFRLLLGLSIIALHFLTDFITGIMIPILVVIGLILIITSLIGICPIYRFLGISTKSDDSW